MRILRSNGAPRETVLGLLSIAIVSLTGGCRHLDAGEIGVFAQDLFLSALAAFLL